LLETLKPVLHSAYAEQNIANPYTHAETSGDEFPPAIAEKKHKSPGYQDKTQVGVGLDAEKTHVEPDVTLGSHHQAWSRPIEDNCFKQHVRSHADDQKMAMINNNCTLAKRKTDTIYLQPDTTVAAVETTNITQCSAVASETTIATTADRLRSSVSERTTNTS
ncbi:hypothetical protein DFQ30_000133, partial [Apophysomyces sp. BC1015]